MPLSMGGNQVKFLIGINNTLLMPCIVHKLPSSICVFQCDFKDIYESRIAFGGLHTVCLPTDMSRTEWLLVTCGHTDLGDFGLHA